MSDVAAGIPIGFGAGFAAGAASGKKQARDAIERNLRDLAKKHTITIQNQEGQSVSINGFLNEALRIYDEKSIIFSYLNVLERVVYIYKTMKKQMK